MEVTSSWLQSIDDLNVPVFILRRSHRRTGVVVVADEDIGVSHGVGSCLPGRERKGSDTAR